MTRSADENFALPRGVDWIPVDTALGHLRSTMPVVVGAETIAVASAAGRVLASAVVGERDNPPVANAAIDGYGFAHSSGGTGLQVVEGSSVPGSPFAGPLEAGQAVRILTGAIVPQGVDTVALEESTSIADGILTMTRCPEPGANIRMTGEDIRRGDRLFSAGERLRVNDLATLAAAGLKTVEVCQRLRVGVLSTGDELVETGQAAGPHDIPDMNRPMLLAMIRQWGFTAVDLGQVPDRRDALLALLANAVKDVDGILTTGGVSASEQDHVAALLKDEGSHHLWRIAMKPGRPMVMACWRSTPILGLPGNPVAAFVCALIFALPALCQIAGETWVKPAGYQVPAAFGKRKKRGRREYLRARLNDDGAAEAYPSEGSGLTTGLAWSDGLVELGDAAMHIQPGDPVRYLPYGSFRLGN